MRHHSGLYLTHDGITANLVEVGDLGQIQAKFMPQEIQLNNVVQTQIEEASLLLSEAQAVQ